MVFSTTVHQPVAVPALAVSTGQGLITTTTIPLNAPTVAGAIAFAKITGIHGCRSGDTRVINTDGSGVMPDLFELSVVARLIAPGPEPFRRAASSSCTSRRSHEWSAR